MSGRPALWASRGIFFVNGAAIGVWSGFIPIVRDKHGLSLSVLGASLLLVGAGALVAMPATGFLVGRFGSRALLRLVPLLFGASLASVITAPSYLFMAAALAIFGALNGAMDVAMNAQALVVEERRGRPAMSAMHGFFSLGGLAGAAAAGLALSHLPPERAGLVLCALVLSIALVSIPFLLRDAPVTRPKTSRLYRPSRAVLLLGVFAFAAFLAEGAMLDWSAALLRDEFRMSVASAPMGYAVFAAAMAAGRLSGDVLVARTSRPFVFRASALLAGGAFLLGLFSGSTIGMFAAFVLFGFGVANLVPVLMSEAGRDEQHPGAAVAAVCALGYSGFLLGPPLIGFAGDAFGLSTAMALVALTCVGLGIAGLGRPPRDLQPFA
jgi:predicted MFS family arabinose efflux permease